MKKRNCAICVAKTKAQITEISFAVTASLFSHMQIVGFLVQRLYDLKSGSFVI